MNNKDIEWRSKKLEQVRKEIESGQLNALRELLPNGVIKQICEECGYYFRTRLLTPLVTVFHMIGAGISRDGSFQSAWQMNGQTGKSGVLSEARKRLPLGVWSRLHQWIVQEVKKESGFKQLWRGHRMIGIDGTCVSMSDEPELIEVFGKLKNRYGTNLFPNARVVLGFDLETLITVGHEVGSCRASEQELSKKLVKDLGAGDVIVFDCLYSGANLYVAYKRAGVEFIGQVHACLNVERLKVVERFEAEDLLVEMRLDPHNLRQDVSLPKTTRVRMIKSRKKKVGGKSGDIWIATSLVDPVKYPRQEIQSWQKKRWKVETLIEEIKIWLGADVLRSKSVEGIYKELYARIIGLNLIHWLILKVAEKHDQKVDRLSVSATLRLAACYSLKMSTAPAWQLPLLYEQMLDRIAASGITYRPNRFEPRMKKRPSKNYPKLKLSRTEWRAMRAVNA